MSMHREANENFRKAAIALSREARKNGATTYLFSSAVRGEGVTTAALAVARELRAGCGRNPLLLEWDLDRPVLAKQLQLDPDRNLHAIAEERLPVAACIQTTSDGLAVIPVGQGGSSANGALRTAALLERIVAAAVPSHDLVLVDAPPLLQSAEAWMIAAVIPRVVLVVEAGRTRVEMLERIQRDLAAENVRLAALVLNKHKRYIPKWVYKLLVQ
jgi:Mrp family chromosome partitioning ATPase